MSSWMVILLLFSLQAALVLAQGTSYFRNNRQYGDYEYGSYGSCGKYGNNYGRYGNYSGYNGTNNNNYYGGNVNYFTNNGAYGNGYSNNDTYNNQTYNGTIYHYGYGYHQPQYVHHNHNHKHSHNHYHHHYHHYYEKKKKEYGYDREGSDEHGGYEASLKRPGRINQMGFEWTRQSDSAHEQNDGYGSVQKSHVGERSRRRLIYGLGQIFGTATGARRRLLCFCFFFAIYK